jgi:hypothetical protein
MARNPLLLTILAQVFKGDPEAGLPARRTELYHRATQAVFRQREAAWGRLADTLGGKDQVKILSYVTAHVAFHLHANPRYSAGLIDGWHVADWIQSAVREEPAFRTGRRERYVVNDFLTAASRLSGFFVARGENAYGFLHRQFQEYFAAWHLVRQIVDAGRFRIEPFLGYLNDPNWREVLLLAVGILEAAAAGKLREEGLTAPPRAVARLLAAVLDAPDPTGGLLPHNLLFAADALAELARPPAEIVRRVATGLIQAYRRDNESRFAVLKKRIERAFIALLGSVESKDSVQKELCAALTDSSTGEASRMIRMAAAELMVSVKRFTRWRSAKPSENKRWFTRPIAQALSESWRTHAEPAGTILAALQVHYEAHPEDFAVFDLPFRKALRCEPVLWKRVEAFDHWRAIAQALYLAPWAEPDPEAVVRDSYLTEDLLTWLRVSPEDREGLTSWLWKIYDETKESAAYSTKCRDAILALTYLEEHQLADFLLDDGENNPLSRTVFGVTCVILVPYLREHFDLSLFQMLDLIFPLDVNLSFPGMYGFSIFDFNRDLTQAWCGARIPAFWTTWREVQQKLAEAKTVEQWTRESRPRLDSERLIDLNTALLRNESWSWSTLLPRLDSSPLTALERDKTTEVQALLKEWINRAFKYHPQVSVESKDDTPPPAESALFARHAALMLAEMGIFEPEILSLLCTCLQSPIDLTRYRARKALDKKHFASALGQNTVEQLAYCLRCSKSGLEECNLVNLYASAMTPISSPVDIYEGVLKKIKHDEPEWLRVWAEKEKLDILSHVRLLDSVAWPTYLDLVATSVPTVQVALLDPAYWFIRRSTVPDGHKIAFRGILQNLTSSDNLVVEQDASRNLNYLQVSESGSAEHLINQPLNAPIWDRYEEEIREIGKSAWVRYVVVRALMSRSLFNLLGEVVRENTYILLRRLITEIPRPHDLLLALLEAGTDDNSWGKYHEEIACLIRNLIKGQRDDRLLTELLKALVSDEPWQYLRIVLAAIAACAEVMPDAFNLVVLHMNSRSLLIEASRKGGNSDTRRHAIVALSHMRMATPAVLEALLDAAGDAGQIQREAVAAAARFRHISVDSQEELLDQLAVIVTGESGARAYVAARLLAALGSSPAALEVPGLRERIAEILAEGLHHPNAEREVYLMSRFNNIRHKGPLSQALFAALVKVWGLPD